MLIDIITLFPEMFAGVFGESIIKRAVDKNILEVRFTQLRGNVTLHPTGIVKSFTAIERVN